ncbi:LuxR C-terminal-related transcriptional regulator [Mucilaginibacter litoreus]|uniref:LuxR C-terminal-related transcriptional regulator n=1 Tax=Mucilaginibacter litoreus TaxID=1048221 RepID=A0ABW3AWT7_9SPHI
MLHTVKLSEELKIKIEEHEATFSLMPGAVIIHDVRDWSVVYMSEWGLKQLGITIEEVTSISSDEYHRRYFNHEDARDYAPKVFDFLQKNNDDIITYFQQVKLPGKKDWTWHLSSSRIFARDDKGKPTYTITLAVPIDAMHHMAAKATRLLAENTFLRDNYRIFSKLTKREKEVLKLIALGKSAAEIAQALFISVTTAETHRKNIKSKLNANTYELMQYARAFDLI